MSQKMNFFFGVKILFLDLVTPSDGGGVAAGGIIAGGFDGCWLCGGRWELGNE